MEAMRLAPPFPLSLEILLQFLHSRRFDDGSVFRSNRSVVFAGQAITLLPKSEFKDKARLVTDVFEVPGSRVSGRLPVSSCIIGAAPRVGEI